jgi:4-hydroxybenzoate polyprenyltransferase
MHTATIGTRLNRYGPVLSILYLSAGGVSAVLGVMMYLEMPFSWLACGVSMGIIFGVYSLNRFTDLREDFANDSARSVFFASHKGLLRWTFGVMSAVVGVLVITNKLSLYFLALLLVVVVYSCRLVPWVKRDGALVFLRLKEVPLVKNLLVSVLWGASIFVVPVILSGMAVESVAALPVGLLAGAMMLSTFNNTLFGDVLDERGDLLVGTRTLPVILGARPCVAFLALINTFWLAGVAVAAVLMPIAPPVLALVFILGVYPALYLVPYWRETLDRRTLEFLSELDLMLFALGMAVVSLV